jgi:hypothetical protein
MDYNTLNSIINGICLTLVLLPAIIKFLISKRASYWLFWLTGTPMIFLMWYSESAKEEDWEVEVSFWMILIIFWAIGGLLAWIVPNKDRLARLLNGERPQTRDIEPKTTDTE